jgi:peptidoglycan/xylan/chitin deacetylase (PgdA/CDA1 family)
MKSQKGKSGKSGKSTKNKKPVKLAARKMSAAVFIIACIVSVLLDVWLYDSLNTVPAAQNSAQSQVQTATTSSIATTPLGPNKTIYLTFDMDMDESMYQKALNQKELWYDPELFEYLESQNIPATFFASGLFLEAYAALIKNLATDANFSFQNHSYDESSFVPNCYWLQTLTTDAEKTAQIAQTESLIQQTTGQTATFFRFPGVCTDPQNDALVQNLGYQIEDGTIISGDPFTNNTQAIVNAVVDQARSGGVVIMHVGGPNAPKSLDAIEQIIPALRAKGYRFAKL